MMILVLLSLLGLLGWMTLAWAVQRRIGNAGWVDVFWSFGVGLAAVPCALVPMAEAGEPTTRQVVVAVLVALWSCRLGLHLARRVSHSAEDIRYTELRHEWGQDFQWRMWRFLMAQGAAAWILVVVVLVAARNPAEGLSVFDYAAISLFVVSLVGEAVADLQLARFKADPKNRGGICQDGLWAWSRHPNLFFEWIIWLAYPLFALDLSGGYLVGAVSLIGPVMMYVVLVHLSGVPPMEKSMAQSRGAAFTEYCARTSRFFPLPPKARAGSPR